MRKWSAIAALSSLLLTLLASGFILLAPCFVQHASNETSISGLATPPRVSEDRSCSSLLETQGSSIIALLAIPSGLAAAGAVALLFRIRVLIWVSAALFLIFSVLTGFSIGLFYIPSSLLLLLAAALDAAPASVDPG